MSFFNSKEEVINIELTQKGKYLLSKGKLNPKYYDFFDDDIVYDSMWVGINEKQNDSQDRILEETAYSKPNANISSADGRLNELNEQIIKNDVKIIDKVGMSFNDLIYSLGKSDYNSEHLPAWNINILEGQISSSADNIEKQEGEDVTYTFIKVPQINLEHGKFCLYSMDKDSMELIPDGDELYVEMSAEDDYNVISSKRNLTNVINVEEKNTIKEDSSFSAEFFVEKDGKWHQLYFFKDLVNIQDDILLDDWANPEVASTLPDENCVEYYFDVQFDNRVNVSNFDKQSIYSSPINDEFKPFGDDC